MAKYKYPTYWDYMYFLASMILRRYFSVPWNLLHTMMSQMSSRPQGHIFTSVSQKCRNSANLKPVFAYRSSRSNSMKRRKAITYSKGCIRFKKPINWSALQYSLLFSTLLIVNKNVLKFSCSAILPLFC